MEIAGQIRNGVVVLEGPQLLPEGAKVTVVYPDLNDGTPTATNRRIQVPLVRTGSPGTLDLTNDMINEILSEEDAARWQAFWDALDAPPKNIPALRKLLTEPSVLDEQWNDS